MAQRKQTKSSSGVKQKKTITKRASTTSPAKKNSSRTRVASKSAKDKTSSGYPQWTEARKHSFIVSVLRAGTRRWPPKYETLVEAKVGKKINSKTGRMAEHYKCRICKATFPATGVEVDHIIPVVSSGGFTTWDEYIERMFVGKEGFQVLCVACHKKKTLDESNSRRK